MSLVDSVASLNAPQLSWVYLASLCTY